MSDPRGSFRAAEAGGERTGRRRIAVAVAVAVPVVLAVLTVAVVVTDRTPARHGDPVAGRSSAAPAETQEAPAVPSVTAPEPGAPVGAPVGSDDELPPALPAATLDAAVDVEGVTASLTAIEAIEGEATGPGDVAGPALRVTVRIQNGTDAAIALDGVTVNVAHGLEQDPAVLLGDPSAEPFSGSLAPGDEAEGVYVFRVPLADREAVRVEVGHRPGAPRAVFSGSTA